MWSDFEVRVGFLLIMSMLLVGIFAVEDALQWLSYLLGDTDD